MKEGGQTSPLLSCPSLEVNTNLSSSLEKEFMIGKLCLCDSHCRDYSSHSNRRSSYRTQRQRHQHFRDEQYQFPSHFQQTLAAKC